MNNRTKAICLIFTLLMFGCGDIANKNTTTQSTAYDRVINSGELKVGYVPYPPGLIKDPNTGELSGVFFETLNAAGKSMGIEVKWTEEVSWGTMIEGLKTNRYDVIGSPVWANSTRGKVASFTVPLFYSGIGVYVRQDENRFDEDLSLLDSKNVKVSMLDGDMASLIANSDFPKATQLALAPLSDNSQLILEVESGKADVTFVEPYFVQLYFKSKTKTLKNLAVDKPIRIFPNSIMMDKGQYDLKSMLDIALSEQINSGFVDKLIQKYTGSDNAFYKTAYPFRVEN
jgi:polar amino acid transport system substrate-binding protein